MKSNQPERNAAGDEDLVELRVPRSPLTVVQGPPSHVSQHTAPREVGLSSGDVYLELAREYGRAGGEVIAVGKTRLVDRERFVAWLAARSKATAAPTEPADEGDTYARELGLRVVAGGKGRR